MSGPERPLCSSRPVRDLTGINKDEINGRLSETETLQSLMSALFGETETPRQCLSPAPNVLHLRPR